MAVGERLIVDYERRIARPPSEVGAQFGDMRHHAANAVHKGIAEDRVDLEQTGYPRKA